MLKKLISVLIVFSLVSTLFVSGLTASAAIINKGRIEIDKVSGVPGDTIVVGIRIPDNPGIMAITVSVTYDSSVLTYEKILFGDVINDYTVVAHPDKNIIRFVNCQSRDTSKAGTLVYFQMKINEKAKTGFYEMDIKYSAGDFCNWNLDKIMPEIVAGGVEVKYNGSNCSHKKYGEWTVAAEPSCEKPGLDNRICETCGHVDLRENDPIGHEYSDKWTIDQPATKEQDGIMTRYCIRCDDYVDRITFSAEQSEEGNIKNEINQEIPVDDFTENIFKEQYPDKEMTESRPAPNKGTNDKDDSKDESKGDKDTDSENKTDKEDGTENSITDILESISPEGENPQGEKVSVFEKIAEVFPNIELITKIAEVALIALLLLVI